MRELPASRAQLRRWVAAAIDRDARLTLRFVGQAEGRMLNRQYRGHDYATNVLTFTYDAPHAEGEAPWAEGEAPRAEGEAPRAEGDAPEAEAIEADIVICLPVLAREARARRIPVANHLAHLVVHGVLHAGGHDHEQDDEARQMEAREVEVLAKFRIADPYLDE